MKRRLLEVFVFCCALALKAQAQTPTILTQPQSITINNASDASFTVVATNAATYQWQFGGVDIPSSTNPTATNATLTLEDVTNTQAGLYSVQITGAHDSSTNSQSAQLIIVPGTMVRLTFSGYADGSSSNVLVQLFDHDKPATVQNFLHYITPAVIPGADTNLAFTNLIWERCIPGFVLQAGDYDATDRTNSRSPPQLESVTSVYSDDLSYVPPFPFNIDNEFDLGPLIHNQFGTIAMAKKAGYPDSAESAFFFNLANNSTNLDNQDGGFTVFGRILSGSNVLAFFNTLSKPDHGIFDATTVGTNASLSALANLPVNDDSRATPANSNLYFADFQVLTPLQPDTNPPTVQVNYPTNGQTVTNINVVMQGTAQDQVSLARVVCTIVIDGNASSFNASGTSNWSSDLGILAPGSYSYTVAAQDGAGNLASNSSSGTFVVPRYPFEATVVGNGSLSTNYNGTNTTVGTTYAITAKPGRGAVFVKWMANSNAYLSPTLTFNMQNGLQLEAIFSSNNVPHGIAFTYPSANQGITNGSFSVSGKLEPKYGSAQVTCQVFTSSGSSVTAPMMIDATNNTWSSPLLGLAPGAYIVQAVAQYPGGGGTVIAENFDVLTPLTIIKYGSGTSTIPNGAWLAVNKAYEIVALPAKGQSVYSWNDGSTSFLGSSIPFTMYEGLTLTVTFVSNSVPKGLTFTSPPLNARVASSRVTLGGKIERTLVAPQVLCQVFEDYEPVTGLMPATVSATNWSLVVSNLSVGSYEAEVIASDALGHTTMAVDVFSMDFYPAIAGTYHGLFFNPGSISNNNAGALSFTLSGSGAVNGNLIFPPGNYPLHFTVGSAGSGTGGFFGPVGVVDLTFIFDTTNLSGQMTGYVSSAGGTVPLLAYRAATKLGAASAPSPGEYVLSLEPEAATNGIVDGPLGTNYAAVNVSAGGNLAVAGALADNTPFSFSTGVFTNGIWPFYASFYKGGGVLIGWETNQPTGLCTGALYWSKTATNGIYYPNGVQEILDSAGAKYVKPASGANYQIVFGGGTLTSPVTNIFSLSTAGAMVPAAGTTDALTGSLLSTGVLSRGSIVNPVNNQLLKFSGAFFGASQGGGFTLDAGTNTGYFQIQLAPH